MSNTPTSSDQVAQGLNLEAERAAPYQFRKKPVVIEAFQFHRRNNGPVPYPDWYDDAMTRNDIITHNTGKWHDPTQPAYCEIKTLEGVMRANEGDWIIRGIKGEIYPCRADIFAVTYEATTPVAEGVALPPLDAEGLPPLPKPHAWQHTLDNTEGIKGNKPHRVLSFLKLNPFGQRGIDYSRSFPVTREPLYTAKQVEQVVELATFKGEHATQLATKSIDTGEFRELLQEYWKCMGSRSAEKVTARIIAYIDGRTAGPAMPQWRSIETAPQDKMLLLAAEFDGPGDWRIKVGGFWDRKWNVFGATWTPTRWMALPAAPKPQEDA